MLNKDQIFEIFIRFRKANPNPKSELIAFNSYTFAIAVLLSAQATDKIVNKITEKLFKLADSPEKMINLGIDELIKYIKPVGFFNNKSKNIMNLSRILIDQYDSNLPKDLKLLEKLPGIGRKSANVILNELFGGNQIAVDTHVMRTSNRIGLSGEKSPISIEQDLANKIPKNFHKNASNWLVLHGRYICKAKKPSCKMCIISDICEGCLLYS
ncbi:MAG: endonuclease III [Holosporales bacterium]|nr:endonuclease III [Holosporales bacterium]